MIKKRSKIVQQQKKILTNSLKSHCNLTIAKVFFFQSSKDVFKTIVMVTKGGHEVENFV